MSTEDGQLSNDTGAKMISTGTKAMGITQKLEEISQMQEKLD